MKQKLPRGLNRKGQKTFQTEGVFARIRFQKTVRKKRIERLTGGSLLSGLKIQTGRQSSSAPESCGGRRRRSTTRQGDRVVPPCLVCPSASVVGGGGRRRALHRRRPLLRRTAARVEMDLAGECCGDQIEAGVSSLGARGDR